jgi:hypothetical protein
MTKLLSFRNKSILAGDLDAEHPVLNREISNPSGLKLLEIFASSTFCMSAPQCSAHYTPDGRSDVLDIELNHNSLLSEAIVTDILDSDHQTIKN